MRVWWSCALCLALASGVACRSTETQTSSDPATEAAREAEPIFLDMTIPAGTLLRLRLETPVASDTSRVEEAVRARVSRSVIIDGQTALPAGSIVSGTVAAVERSGRVKGRARIAMRFSALQVGDTRYDIDAAPVSATAPATKKEDAAKIGLPAAGGAIIGALAGGGKGAAAGAGVGAGAGTAVVLSTRGEEVRLGRGAQITLKLTMPLRVRVPGGGETKTPDGPSDQAL